MPKSHIAISILKLPIQLFTMLIPIYILNDLSNRVKTEYIIAIFLSKQREELEFQSYDSCCLFRNVDDYVTVISKHHSSKSSSLLHTELPKGQ